MTSEGSGVGRVDGLAVFVPQTAVGDVAEIKIVKVLKNYAYGIVKRLIAPSPDRIMPDCDVFSQCGGCAFRHVRYDAELRIKDGFVRDAFARIGGLSPEFEPILGSAQTNGYRNKAQYPVGLIDGKPVCGFYAKRSHRIVPAVRCALQPKEFEPILSHIMAYVRARHISVYDEKTGKGLLRHICLRMGAYSRQLQIVLVVSKRCDGVFETLAAQLAHSFKDIKSVVLNINAKNTNVIMGSECFTLFGGGTISDTMCGLNINLSPLSFYQVNTRQAEHLYGIAKDYAQLGGGETVLDLYCGTGTIGLGLASHARQIIGVETVEQAVRDAQENARNNGIVNARFICADAAQAAKKLQSEKALPDVVVLDPPRKGCDREVLQTVAGLAPSRIVMISCNPATAARDCAILEQAGYRTVRARAVDLFPRTVHVETVVLMSRVKE